MGSQRAEEDEGIPGQFNPIAGLSQILGAKRLPPEEAVKIMEQVGTEACKAFGQEFRKRVRLERILKDLKSRILGCFKDSRDA